VSWVFESDSIRAATDSVGLVTSGHRPNLLI
jgi:hypothetical protein